MQRAKKSFVPKWISLLIEQLKVEDFISEIEAQPAIWNSSVEEYSDNKATEWAWYQICSKLDADFEQRDAKEKNLFGKQLHRRWKSLRDCYRRELQKQKSEKSASTGRKKYIYFKQLRFLEPVTCFAESTPDQEGGVKLVDEQVDEPMENEKTEELSPSTPTKRSRKKREDTELIQILKKRVAQSNSETFPASDPDTYFMLSLVPEIQKIPENQKLLVKTQLMNVILQAQSSFNTGGIVPPQAHMPMYHQPPLYNPPYYHNPQLYHHPSAYNNPPNLITSGPGVSGGTTFQGVIASPHSEKPDASNDSESFPYFTQKEEK